MEGGVRGGGVWLVDWLCGVFFVFVVLYVGFLFSLVACMLACFALGEGGVRGLLFCW